MAGKGLSQWKTLHHMSPDSKVHGAIMGPTWVLSAPDGPHVGPVNLAIRVFSETLLSHRRKSGPDLDYINHQHNHHCVLTVLAHWLDTRELPDLQMTHHLLGFRKGNKSGGKHDAFDCWLYSSTRLIPGLRPANERQRHYVTTSLIDWAHI